MSIKYVAKPTFRGNSRCVDMVEEEDQPRSDTPINDYLQALDDRFTQSQQELKNDVRDLKDAFKKQLENSSDYVVRTLVERDESKDHDKLKTFLYGGAFVALIYLHAIAPVLNTSAGIAGKIIDFLPIASESVIQGTPQKAVSSNLDPSRIVEVMQRKGYRIRTGPGELNVVYVFNPNFAETIDTWSDRRLLITFKDNKPVVVHDSPATIKGGLPSWNNPPNPKGYPITIPGQYNAWAVGYHKGKRALQQVGPIPVMRTKDQGRTWRPDRGLFGINQHRGGGKKVRNWSEGCLVSQSGHDEFMRLIYTDPGYRQNKSFRFITTLISMNDLATPQLNNIGERNAKQI